MVLGWKAAACGIQKSSFIDERASLLSTSRISRMISLAASIGVMNSGEQPVSSMPEAFNSLDLLVSSAQSAFILPLFRYILEKEAGGHFFRDIQSALQAHVDMFG